MTGPEDRLPRCAFGAVLAAAGAGGFAAAFDGSDLVRPVAIAAIAGAAAAAPVARAGGLALAFALLAAAGTFPALGESPAVLVQVWSDGGWRTVRDTLGPAAASPGALAVPYLATALAAFLGTLGSRRGGPVVRVLLPSLVVMVLGFALGDSWRAGSLLVPLMWAAVALPAIGWHHGQRRSWPAAASGLLVVAAVVAGAGPVGGKLPLSDERWVLPPESAVEHQVTEQPLAAVTEFRSGTDQPLFTATTSAPVQRWRLVVLDGYDGRQWTSTQLFRPVAGPLPLPPDAPEGGGTELTQSIELNRPDGEAEKMPWGRWLPVADRVVWVSIDGAGFDLETGVLLAPDGPMPATYHAESRPEALTETELGGAPAGSGPDADHARFLPDGLPADLEARAEEITEGAATPYARAVEIQRYLAGDPNELVVDDPPGGHTLAHIDQFLSAEDGLRGAAEHYVTAFAVLARLVDLPARVVVGFDGAGTVGEQQVSTHAATAWVEVKFEGHGWQTFDPVPDPTGETAPPEPPIERGAGDEAETQDHDEVAGGEAADPDDERRERPPSTSSGAPGWLSAVPVALVVLAVVAPAAIRAGRRMSRHRATGPAARIAAAWATVADELRAAQVPAGPTLVVTDVVRAARGTLPAVAEQLDALGDLVNRASFARRPPGEGDAERAWELCRTIVAARRQGRSPRQRLRDHFRV